MSAISAACSAAGSRCMSSIQRRCGSCPVTEATKWERKLYVKQYTKQKGKQKPRIIVSVRVTFRD